MDMQKEYSILLKKSRLNNIQQKKKKTHRFGGFFM